MWRYSAYGGRLFLQKLVERDLCEVSSAQGLGTYYAWGVDLGVWDAGKGLRFS